MDIIRVRLAEPESGRVALWERHPAHPGGEVWLAGAGEYDVAATPAVAARLRNGSLVQVEATAPAPEPKGTGARPEKDAQVDAEVPAEQRPTPKGRKDAAGGEGRVLPGEEPEEDVSIVTRTTGEGAPASRPQKRKAVKGGL